MNEQNLNNTIFDLTKQLEFVTLQRNNLNTLLAQYYGQIELYKVNSHNTSKLLKELDEKLKHNEEELASLRQELSITKADTSSDVKN